MLTQYQQRLADAEYREIATTAKLTAAQARIQELEAAAPKKEQGAPKPKPGASTTAPPGKQRHDGSAALA